MHQINRAGLLGTTMLRTILQRRAPFFWFCFWQTTTNKDLWQCNRGDWATQLLPVRPIFSVVFDTLLPNPQGRKDSGKKLSGPNSPFFPTKSFPLRFSHLNFPPGCGTYRTTFDPFESFRVIFYGAVDLDRLGGFWEILELFWFFWSTFEAFFPKMCFFTATTSPRLDFFLSLIFFSDGEVLRGRPLLASFLVFTVWAAVPFSWRLFFSKKCVFSGSTC